MQMGIAKSYKMEGRDADNELFGTVYVASFSYVFTKSASKSLWLPVNFDNLG